MSLMHDSRTFWKLVHGTPSVRELIRHYRSELEAESASILIVGAEEMRFCVVEGLNAERLEGGGGWDGAMGIPLSESRGINSIAALMGKTLCFQEMDERHNRDADEALGQKTHSILVVPVVGEQGVIGTLSAINPHAGGAAGVRYRFLEEDIAIGEVAAQQISTILHELLRSAGA
ncbi:GAF domain-containing protein [Candidatus Sumerlaeota bacterium]|nr:GAF domain-containing protein [Candidatus Sumerlaeota bacterium]